VADGGASEVDAEVDWDAELDRYRSLVEADE
jgi:hypothetical protein